jgi:CubicO group peptidase (beta-lactamase class C family)
MDLELRLDSVARKAIADGRIVGSVLMVRQGGRVLYEKATGLADRELGTPMALDTIFRLSSLTKPIVAATILALVDAGRIRLTDEATDHLPDFRPRLADGTAPSITIHHLLTHTSGLSSASILSEDEVAAGVNRWRLPTDEILGRLAALPLLFAPAQDGRMDPA